MMTYKLITYPNGIALVRSDGVSIPFDPANTDYQRFKADIEAGAELQDADGSVMSSDDAKAFIATLP